MTDTRSVKNEAVQTLVRKPIGGVTVNAAACPRCPPNAHVEVLEKRPNVEWYMCDNCGFVWRVYRDENNGETSS